MSLKHVNRLSKQTVYFTLFQNASFIGLVTKLVNATLCLLLHSSWLLSNCLFQCLERISHSPIVLNIMLLMILVSSGLAIKWFVLFCFKITSLKILVNQVVRMVARHTPRTICQRDVTVVSKSETLTIITMQTLARNKTVSRAFYMYIHTRKQRLY